MSPRVVLFGLDGATYTVLDDLVHRGVMPFLGEFMERSARRTLRSTIPPLTPPAWTTVVTGRSPGAHGVFNFLQFEGEDSPYLRIISSRSICTETIWSIVARHGLRAGSLNFVAHHPAPKIDGYVIPGWVPWRWVKQHSHPAELVDRLKGALPGFDVKELAMNFKEEEKAVAGSRLEDYEPWIDLHIRRERQWFEVMRYQMLHDPCELVGIVFDGVDKLQHLVWQFLDPKTSSGKQTPEFRRIQEKCWKYFSQIDDFLRETVNLVGSDGHVIIVSDHGFTGTTEVVYINTFLEQQGYLKWLPTAELELPESRELGEAHPYHLTHFDMPHTRAFASSASSNGIHIPIDGARGMSGVSRAGYTALQDEISDALLTQCADPETGDPLVTYVWKREDVFAGPHVNLAPSLTLALRDCGFFSVLRSDCIVRSRPVVMGCHHPDGVFLAHGPAVRPGVAEHPLALVDVAPTVLHLLSVPIPSEFEGRIPRDVLSDSWTAKAHELNPVAVRELAQPTESESIDVGEDKEGEAQILMRLRALGYIE